MWVKRIFLKYCLSILVIGCVGVAVADASPGQSFWSIYVGNYWNHSGTGPGYSWTSHDEFISTELISGRTTYKLDEGENGAYDGNEWYEVTLPEIKIWKKTYWDDDAGAWVTIAVDNGLPVGKNPIVLGVPWSNTSNGTGTVGVTSYPGTVTLYGHVLASESVTTPSGTYTAYKVQHTYTISAPTAPPFGYFRTFTEYKWFVPYLGVIKWQSGDLTETELLTSMKIRKGLFIFDRDNDAKTDFAIYRSSTGAWYIRPSSGASPYGIGWGGDISDKPVPGDYDGDGKTDAAVYRTLTGAWYIRPSSGASPYGVGWGGDLSDKPAPGVYNGDGRTDFAVYRTGTGAWYVKPSSGASPYGVGWGGDVSDKPATMNPSSLEP